MRDYGQVQSSFWQSEDAQVLSDGAKLLAVYLLTSPHTNGIGCFRLPDGYVMGDLGWSSETVSKLFAELFAIGYAENVGNAVFLPNFMRWNGISNRNVAKARFSEFEKLPSREAKQAASVAMLRFGTHWTAEQKRVLETLSETLSETVCQPETKPNQTKPEPKDCSAAPPASPPTPAGDVVVQIPVNTGDEVPITAHQVREFSDLYPAVDVAQSLRAMRAWCVSNPAKRKTRGGVMRFVNAWLAKEQNRGSLPSRSGSRAPSDTAMGAVL